MNSVQLQQYIDAHNRQVELIDKLRAIIVKAYCFVSLDVEAYSHGVFDGTDEEFQKKRKEMAILLEQNVFPSGHSVGNSISLSHHELPI
jgi:hypothetical protein